MRPSRRRDRPDGKEGRRPPGPRAVGPVGGAVTGAAVSGGVLLLASATGIGPLRAVLAALRPGSATIIYRAAGPADEDFRRALHAAAAAGGARAYYLPDTGAADRGPLAPPRVRALIPVLRRQDVHVYGPRRVAAAAVTALRGAGIPADRIAVTAS
jgi:ferredoxin-NADP reductase